jgi:purine-binding chemotaxis protein CheW
LCHARHDVLCALPLEQVVETMRPLETMPLSNVPSFIKGLALVRGVPTPVVDAASLLNGQPSSPTRFVSVKQGNVRVVLAVEDVVGVIAIPRDAAAAFPRLFQNFGSDAISAIGVLESDLLLVLQSTRLIPDDAWSSIRAGIEAA